MLPDLKQKIRQLFDKTNIGSILIVNSVVSDPNFFYLTRMTKSEFAQSILIVKKNSITLIVPKMEFELARAQSKKTGVKVKPFTKKSEINKLISEEAEGERIGLNFSRVSINTFKSLKKILKGKKFVDVSESLAEMRNTKTKQEIELISKACRIASRVMKEVPRFMKIGMKERELAAEIDRRMKMYGADEVAFPTIVACGRNSANPHYTAGDSKIKKGDFVLTDFGCKVENYCSDMTRTFTIGKPSDKQEEILDLCRKMQNETIRMLKPGVKIEALQEKANSICESKYGKMLHMIGHSLGVEVHDPLGNAKELKEGIVITIEPGIYVTGLGGVRIEDDILITKTGYKILTKTNVA